MSETLPEAPAQDTDREIAAAQLQAADPDVLAGDKDDIKTGTFEFKGEKFHVAEKIGAMALLEWARSSDLDTNDPAALTPIFYMLEDCVHEKEFSKFRAHARKTKADADELLDVINKAMEVISGNPTEQSSGSSGSSTETSAA